MDVNAALNDLIVRINEILAEEEYSDYLLERVFRIKQDLVHPVTEALHNDPAHEAAVREVRALFKAVEEYVVCFTIEPAQRETRRKRVEGLKAIVRRRVLGDADQEGEIELLLDEIRQWQWKTSVDAQGRLVYATPGGKQVPPRAIIAEKVGPAVIERAVKALRPYAEKLRPRDVRGEPGGLVKIEDAARAIIVGDLHGRYHNLEYILKDKNNLEDILAGRAHLVFTGDAIHPPRAALQDSTTYEDSFCTMMLIVTLKAENPSNVHYLIGNHDHAHIGGRPAGRGDVRQDMLFEKYAIERFGKPTFEHYREFVRLSPVALKFRAPNGCLLVVHAGLTPRILSEQGLINIGVRGPRGVEVTDMLWSRKYDDRPRLAKCLANVDARLMVVGHTPPTLARARRYGLDVIAPNVFAHVHNLAVIINAQGGLFGYLDLDLTRPLPDSVTDLLAPNGKPAFRLLRPRNLAPGNGNGEPPPAEPAS